MAATETGPPQFVITYELITNSIAQVVTLQ